MNYEEMTSGGNTVYDSIVKEGREARQKTPYVMIDVRSTTFKIVAIICAVFGVMAGFVCGFAFPIIELDESFKYIEVAEESFNWVLMLGVWAAFASIAVAFWAVYCHLANQEETIKELKLLNMKIKSE